MPTTDDDPSSTDARSGHQDQENEKTAAAAAATGLSIKPDVSPLATAEPAAAPDDLPGWKVLVIWSAIALGVLCTFLDEGIIATAIPRITDDFGSLTDVGVSSSKRKKPPPPTNQKKT